MCQQQLKKSSVAITSSDLLLGTSFKFAIT